MKVYTPHIVLMRRTQYLHMEDSRCYNGAYYNAEYRWREWRDFDYFTSREMAEKKLKFWQELNDYAVSERGASAQVQYKLVDMELASED